MGSKRYPKGANVRPIPPTPPTNPAYSPHPHRSNSGLFTQDEYAAVHVSNTAILSMLAALGFLARCTSWVFVAKVYLVPFLVTNHW